MGIIKGILSSALCFGWFLVVADSWPSNIIVGLVALLGGWSFIVQMFYGIATRQTTVDGVRF